MVKIIWTTRALTDLQEIGEYISRNSVQYAGLTIEKEKLNYQKVALH